MASSGRIYGSFSGISTSIVRPYIDWQVVNSEADQLANNRSQVECKLYFYKYNTSYFAYNSNGYPCNITINGSSSTVNTAFDCRGTANAYLIRTRTIYVDHNQDGTKSCGISSSGDTNTGWGSVSLSSTVTLDTIPRDASISSAGNLTIGNNYPFSVSNDGDLYIKAILYVWDGSSWDVVKTQNMGTPQGSTTMTLGATENNIMYQAMPNNTSRSLKLRIYTYSDSGYSNQIGDYDDDDNTVYINQDINKPTFTDFTVSNVDKSVDNVDKYSNVLNTASTSTLLGLDSKMIKGYSKLRAVVSVANKMDALNYATESKYRFESGTKYKEGNYNDVADVNLDIDNAEVSTVSVTAYDSRSLTTKVTDSTSITNNADYEDVNLWGVELIRDNGVDSETTLEFSGSYWNEYFGGGTSGVQNSFTAEWRYKESTASWGTQTWNDITASVVDTDGALSFSEYINGDLGASGFDSNKSFDIEVRIYDELSNTIVEQTLSRGTPVLDITQGGLAVGGRFDATKSGILQVEGGITLVDNTIEGFLDEDNFASNSATKVASQQSIKSYIDEKSEVYALRAGTSSTPQTTSTGPSFTDHTRVPLNQVHFNNGSKLSLNTTHGVIYIGAGVSVVKISGSIYYGTGAVTDDLMRAAIGVQGSEISRNFMRAGAYTVLPIPAMFVNVSEGNYVEIRGNNGARTGTYIANVNAGTWLQVEVIK